MIDLIKKDKYGFEDFVEIVRLLRGPDGCPWDRVQTHQSIRRNFLEETYECCEALDSDDMELMKEELGDVMMQVIFHAGIESDRGRFTLEDICDTACKKLIFRHPNVFGPKTEQTWEDMKALEKGQKTAASTLDAVARSLPALWRAEKLVKKAKNAGFRWQEPEEILDRMGQSLGDGHAAEKLGDLLFSVVCVAALTEQDPEMALHSACETFIRRFTAMEQAVDAQGLCLENCGPDLQLSLWKEAENGDA